MALFVAGAVVGQVSGRVGSNVFAKNRYGSYVRNGTVPITSTTSYATAAKARMTGATQAWQGLTAGQRQAWTEWAAANPVLNRVGQQIHLTGHAAYVGNRCRLIAAGQAAISSPPTIAAPAPLLTLTGTWDIGLGNFEITYTATPLGAAEYLWIDACVTRSPGINYVENLMRFIGVSAAAQASPFDSQTLVEARLGTLIVDDIVTLYVSVFSSASGLLSAPLRVRGTVVST